MSGSLILFFILALGSILTALLMVTRRNPVISVIYLIANFFFLAVLYLTLEAQFIAIIQILVYAGAIMVLFLFVIMLLNLGDERSLSASNPKLSRRVMVVVGLCLAMLVQLALPFYLQGTQSVERMNSRAAEIGTVESMGQVMFTDFVFPFEVVSILLLAAIVGAVVLAKRKFQ
jgi:NADH-quinone oxidoreductase subunit J